MNDTPAERAAEGTWTRLRRRKVVQWGIAYVAGAWALLQGLEYLSTTFDWSRHIQQLATIGLIVGLPIVLVLAWYHGDRGEQRIRGTELLIVTLLFVVGGGLLWRFDRAREPTVEASGTAAQSAAPAAAPTPPPDEKSIAVLPFVDMSAAKDQEYMSDGIAEELLNLLAKAPDLKVIARTSSFAFKGEKVPIEDIAKKLNVAHVLEGSVRTAGDKLRITAQLIRTADSTHLWSETYDRPLKDIFAVQDEIANAIAQVLQIKLMGGSVTVPEGGTQNLEAYKLYLQGHRAINENTTSASHNAVAYFEKATELDPHFGHAWLGLAASINSLTDNGLLEPTAGYTRVRQLALHAMELSPSLAAQAHSWLQYVHLALEWDWKAAEREGILARQLAPDDPGILAGDAFLWRTIGRWDDAERLWRAALTRDPLDPYSYWNLGLNYYLAGRMKDSEAAYRRVFELSPDFSWMRSYLGKTLLAQGKPEAALSIVQDEADNAKKLLFLPIFLRANGRAAEAEDALREQIAEWGSKCRYCIAQTYAHRGDHDAALLWLERAYKAKDPLLVEIFGEPLLDGMASDPRFKAFLRKMNMPEWPRHPAAPDQKATET